MTAESTDNQISYKLTKQMHECGSFEYLNIESNIIPPSIIEGELYFAASPKDTNVYSLRWATNSSADEFFTALSKIIPKNQEMYSETAITLIPFDGLEDKFTGLIVFAAAGSEKNLSFYPPFLQTVEPLANGSLSVSDLRQAAQYISNTSELVEIEALRWVTPFGDFQLDITPYEQSGVREVFVITGFDIGEQVASLYQLTSSSDTNTPRLAKALAEITTTVPRYSVPTEASSLAM